MTHETQHSPRPRPDSTPSDDGQQIIEHLNELRRRLTFAAIGVLLGMSVGLFLVYGPTQLIDIIITAFVPVNEEYAPLQSVGTVETFTSYMTVALGVGLVIGMPNIVYQLIAFVAPGLHANEKRFIFRSLPFVTLFFIGGLAFGWYLTVPTAIRFLIGFSESSLIQIQPTLSDFLRTVTVLLLMNGIIFELPIIIYVLAFMGITTAQQLGKYRRYAVVIVAIVAALITPTGDPINLALLAIPMYLLFELGIILARFVPHRA